MVASQCESFTLIPAHGYGEDIDVKGAHVLPKVNQLEQVLPKIVDPSKYLHFQDLKFLDVRRVSILVGGSVTNAPCECALVLLVPTRMDTVWIGVRAPAEKKNFHGNWYPHGGSFAGPLIDRWHRGIE